MKLISFPKGNVFELTISTAMKEKSLQECRKTCKKQQKIHYKRKSLFLSLECRKIGCVLYTPVGKNVTFFAFKRRYQYCGKQISAGFLQCYYTRSKLFLPVPHLSYLEGSHLLDLVKCTPIHCQIDLMVQKENYDLIFMDMHMPILDGLGAITYIRESDNKILKKTPIIVLTAIESEEEKKKCKKSILLTVSPRSSSK